MTDENTVKIPFADVSSPTTFESAELLCDYIESIAKHTGVCNDAVAISKSDVAECVSGYIKVKNNGTGGVIKYTTIGGTVDTDQFDAGKVSEFRVKKIWSIGTDVSEADIRILI